MTPTNCTLSIEFLTLPNATLHKGCHTPIKDKIRRALKLSPVFFSTIKLHLFILHRDILLIITSNALQTTVTIISFHFPVPQLKKLLHKTVLRDRKRRTARGIASLVLLSCTRGGIPCPHGVTTVIEWDKPPPPPRQDQ